MLRILDIESLLFELNKTRFNVADRQSRFGERRRWELYEPKVKLYQMKRREKKEKRKEDKNETKKKATIPTKETEFKRKKMDEEEEDNLDEIMSDSSAEETDVHSTKKQTKQMLGEIDRYIQEMDDVLCMN